MCKHTWSLLASPRTAAAICRQAAGDGQEDGSLPPCLCPRLERRKKNNEASVCSKCLLTAMPRAVATRMLIGPFVTLLSGHLVKYMLEFSVLSCLWLCRRALACVFFRHNISVDLTVQERIYFFAARL